MAIPSNITLQIPSPIIDANDLLIQVGRIGLWLQALGILAIVWFIFYIIGYISSRKNKKNISEIKENLEKVEKKVDKLLSKK